MTNPFALNWLFIALLITTGLFCMIISRSLIRQLIGLEIMSKGAMLAVIAAGHAAGRINLAQAVVITLIVIEVVVVAAGLALLVKNYRINGSVDIWQLKGLRG